MDRISVVCPHCEHEALVLAGEHPGDEARFVCSHCGKSKEGGSVDRVIRIGEPFDCYFGFPLWLSTDFKGHRLFAYNRSHLRFLREFVEDPLRERAPDEHGWSNQSLQSRLPKWMLSAANREGILRKLEDLEKK